MGGARGRRVDGTGVYRERVKEPLRERQHVVNWRHSTGAASLPPAGTESEKTRSTSMSLVMPPSVIPAHADEGPATVYTMRSCLPPSFLRTQTKAPRLSTP